MATGQLFRNIVTSISEWERGVVGERIGPLPYGHTLGWDGKHVSLDPTEAPVVSRMIPQRKRGASLGRLAARLNAARVPTKNGGACSPATVKSVLETAAKWAGITWDTSSAVSRRPPVR
jgi:hypothetical protein